MQDVLSGDQQSGRRWARREPLASRQSHSHSFRVWVPGGHSGGTHCHREVSPRHPRQELWPQKQSLALIPHLLLSQQWEGASYSWSEKCQELESLSAPSSANFFGSIIPCSLTWVNSWLNYVNFDGCKTWANIWGLLPKCLDCIVHHD